MSILSNPVNQIFDNQDQGFGNHSHDLVIRSMDNRGIIGFLLIIYLFIVTH